MLVPSRRDFCQDAGAAQDRYIRRLARKTARCRYLVWPGHNGTFVEYDHPTEGHVKTPGFPIRFSKTPSTVDRGAPLTGEHTRDVLREAGFADEAIDALLASKAVLQEGQL